MLPTWLTLVLDDADDDRLAAHLASCLSEAAPGTEPLAHREAERARRLRDLVRQGRRRTAELGVVNDLSQQLARLHDPTDVLREVARRARLQLGADVAYLMLPDTDGTLPIQYVDGALGHGLRRTRLRPGEGIGGRVFETGQAFWSGDYLTDETVRHATGVDEVAAQERLGGILGVPLRTGEEVTGVLLVAEHRPRAFTDAEVVRLSALAAPAAIAIRNAQLITQREAALRSQQEAAALHDDLTGIVANRGGLPEVAAALARALGAGVVITTTSGHVVASSDPGLRPPRADRAAGSSAGSTAGSSPGSTTAPPGGAGWHCVPVRAGGVDHGRLWVCRAQSLTPADVRSTERAALVIALSMATERELAEQSRRGGAELAAALFVDSPDHQRVRRRAEAVGLELGRVATVVVVGAGGPGAERVLARLPRAWSGQVADSTVALLDQTADEVSDVLGPAVAHHVVVAAVPGAHGSAAIPRLERAPTSAGANGSAAAGVTAVAAAWRRADRGLGVLTTLGRPPAVVRAEDLGVLAAVLSSAAEGAGVEHVRWQLGPLLDRDAATGSDLVGTLGAYLSAGRSHAATAARLGVHTNTLYQRLHRIDELLGERWREPERAFELGLALELHRLSERVGGPAG
ncbi:helix-turn-helix domain-containing protein [Arsenicicoccus bolidensis]|uniref:helix-turn-helix domain-containing protein n=1 Tax=Arsenicicoccus bolidensis TaxID=229480 RepID=UPI0004152F12|nr:GAF domain-containing protein [Arsenicicoccus bolidensis]